jgi:hypothetical protein
MQDEGRVGSQRWNGALGATRESALRAEQILACNAAHNDFARYRDYPSLVAGH